MSTTPKMKNSKTLEKKPTVGKTKINKLPTYEQMIQQAIKSLPRSPKGCSRSAIQSYIFKHFQPTGTVARTNFQISYTLKKMTELEKLILVSGVGAAGRFRLPPVLKGSTTKRTTKKLSVKRALKLGSSSQSNSKHTTPKKKEKKDTKPKKTTKKSVKSKNDTNKKSTKSVKKVVSITQPKLSKSRKISKK